MDLSTIDDSDYGVTGAKLCAFGVETEGAATSLLRLLRE
jgi:hypothetical protein